MVSHCLRVRSRRHASCLAGGSSAPKATGGAWCNPYQGQAAIPSNLTHQPFANPRTVPKSISRDSCLGKSLGEQLPLRIALMLRCRREQHEWRRKRTTASVHGHTEELRITGPRRVPSPCCFPRTRTLQLFFRGKRQRSVHLPWLRVQRQGRRACIQSPGAPGRVGETVRRRASSRFADARRASARLCR